MSLFPKKSVLVTLFLTVLLSASQVKAQKNPDFQPDLTLSFEDFKAQALQPKADIWVLDFWASWCRPCIGSIPHLKGLNAHYRDKGVRFISLSWDDDKGNWEKTVRRFEMDWDMILIPTLGQPEPWLDSKFPHGGIPTAFVISPDGKIKKVNDVYGLEKVIDKEIKKRD